MNTPKFKPGDVIGFSGRCLASDGINLATFGLPRWGLSHVGIVVESRYGLLLFESTKASGVLGISLSDVINGYDGRAWLYELSRPAYAHEMTRMSHRLSDLCEREYDMQGALRSGGRVWSWVQAAARGEDLTSLFCSELVAEVLSHAGIFNTANASRWSPNHLVRTLRRLGIVNPPRRLK